MPFTIVRQDLTVMQVDAVVNAANTALAMGGGVCGAIFRAAGAQELQKACQKVGPIETGDAAITPGFRLPARFVIHAAGPVYDRCSPRESERLLRSAYRRSMELALEHHCQSIAFPLISSGIYGYPKDKALQTAVSEIRNFLEKQDLDVYLTIFDRASFSVSREILGPIESYIDQNYVDLHEVRRMSRMDNNVECCMIQAAQSLEDLVGNLDEPFNSTLLRLIDKKGKTDVEVYKKANLDRKLFSKIRTHKDYLPSKRTVLALAVALELTLEETEDLLRRAGFALSSSRKFDVIIKYYLESRKYDIFEINQVLFRYDQPLLGGV